MSDKYIAFFNKLNRSKFVNDDEDREKAFYRANTDPNLILKMIMLLNLNEDDIVLEVGTGSGYQTAFLAEFAKKVYTIEVVEEYLETAKKTLGEMGYSNVEFLHMDGSLGYEAGKPYSKILITAAVSDIPFEILSQLEKNGKMIIAVGDDINQELLLIEKVYNGEIIKHVIGKVSFPEFKGKYGHNNE